VYVYVYVYTYVYSTGTSEVLPEVLVHERVLSYNVRKYFRTSEVHIAVYILLDLVIDMYT
jgi:hypothetical protein